MSDDIQDVVDQLLVPAQRLTDNQAAAGCRILRLAASLLVNDKQTFIEEAEAAYRVKKRKAPRTSH